MPRILSHKSQMKILSIKLQKMEELENVCRTTTVDNETNKQYFEFTSRLNCYL